MKNFNKIYQFDYNGFFSMIEKMGDDLNTPSLRFLKGRAIEIGLCQATDFRLIHIDTTGCDLQDSKTKEDFESKSQKYCLYTRTGKLKRKTSTIKLTNTLQKGQNKSLKCSSDWLIITDTGSELSYSMAIISYKEVVDNYSKEVNDGFTCQIPMDKLTFLVKPEEIELFEIPDAASAKKEIDEALKRLTAAFFNRGE